MESPPEMSSAESVLFVIRFFAAYQSRGKTIDQELKERINIMALQALEFGVSQMDALEGESCLFLLLKNRKRKGRPKKDMPGDPIIVQFASILPEMAKQKNYNSVYQMIPEAAAILNKRLPHSTKDAHAKQLRRILKRSEQKQQEAVAKRARPPLKPLNRADLDK